MQLSPHFSLQEFTESETAVRLGIDNSLPDYLLEEAKATCELQERIRAYLSHIAGRDIPMVQTSGYRCLALNTALRSKPTSDHVKALAGDWKAPSFGSPFDICRALAASVDLLGIGQLIHEYGTWVHTSRRRPDKLVNRVITIGQGIELVGIHPL